MKEQRVFYLVALTFILEVIIYRYYRGPRYEYYSFFAHPTVLILSAWTLNKVTEVQKLVGTILIVSVVLITLNQSILNLKETQVSLKKINNLKKEIYSAFPLKKFDIFSCPFQGGVVGHPLSLVMYSDGKNSEEGISIMACENPNGLVWNYLPKDKISESANFYSLTTSRVYRDTAEWWQDKPPKKDTNFGQFLKRKLNPECYPHCD